MSRERQGAALGTVRVRKCQGKGTRAQTLREEGMSRKPRQVNTGWLCGEAAEAGTRARSAVSRCLA